MDLARQHSQRRLVDDVAVGRNTSADDRLAEAERALDGDAITRSRSRIDGEHNACTVDVDLPLDDDCDVHVGLRKTLLCAIENRPCAEQRPPAASHGVDDGIGAACVQERLVHARE